MRDVLTTPPWTGRLPAHGAVGPFPLIGSFAADWTLSLGFLFVLGATLRLYARRVPLHGALAGSAVVVLVGTLWLGGFFVFGLPAYAYLVLYLAVALPERLARLGYGRDYTYGLYIYGFPVQQLLALVGAQRFGLVGYIVLSLVGTLLLAVPSWYLVERPALRWKGRGGASGYQRRHGVPVPQAPGAVPPSWPYPAPVPPARRDAAAHRRPGRAGRHRSAAPG